jgi:outer membrane protein assembly factor BamD
MKKQRKAMTYRRTLPVALCSLLLLAGAAACRKPKVAAKAKEAQGQTAAEILKEGDIYLQNGKWEEGRRILRVIEERLPSSAEFPASKLMVADSFFFGSTSTYPEAMVEYQSFLNYFPRHEKKDYALYRIALCHYAAIENAERDQSETRKALDGFQALLKDAPGSVYAVDAKAKITQCWRRLAESELMVGIFMVKNYQFAPAENRIKGLLDTYPEYVDRERAYYFLGEALRQRPVHPETLKQFTKDYLAKTQKADMGKLTREEGLQFNKEFTSLVREELAKFRDEAKGYYQKLVESYPGSEWAGKANDRLLEMGQAGRKEELDS